MDTPGLTIDGSGARPTITKTATDESARRRLAHEAEMLRRAEHPGVVTLLGHERDGEVEVLRTAYCGSRTLATTTSMSVARVAGTISALATTVADLHDMGLAHGRLTADHVVINADGRPVVCGFAEAVAGDAARSRRADDVAALGTLLHGLLAGHDDLAPLPVSRFGRRGAWTGYQRRALLNLADQAACDDPMLRPTARQLAQSIRATVPDATLVDAHAPADSPLAHLEADEPARRRTLPVPHLRMVGTAAALIAVALALARFAFATDPDRTELVASEHHSMVDEPDHAGSEPSHTDPPPPSSPATTTTTTTTTTTSVPAGPDQTPTDRTSESPEGPRFAAAGCSARSGSGPSASTLAGGDPCPVDLHLAAGVLSIGAEQFHLGLDDAAVAIGDFACRGTPVAAILDQTTGHVFVFEDWADDDTAVSASSVRQVEAPGRLLAESAGADGCHRLVALDRYGIRYVIPLEDVVSLEDDAS